MRIIGVDNHAAANKMWKDVLGSRPNGARTLGTAMEKYLAPILEQYYDVAIFYAADLLPQEVVSTIPKGSRIFVAHHQNFPWASGITVWRKVNGLLCEYDVDYFCNEKYIVKLIRENGGQAYYLPRFIDTTTMIKPKKEKTIDTLWFGNRWNEFRKEFTHYELIAEKPYWLSHNIFGKGEEQLYDLGDRDDALRIVAEAKKVWAIGVSQLEAQYLGAEVISYRGDVLPFYDQSTITLYLEKLLQTVVQRLPKS